MTFTRGGDASATYPAVMRVRALPSADERSINEVMGFIFRLACQSSAHLTDYIVDPGTVELMAGARTKILLKQCERVGLLTAIRTEDGMRAYKLVDDPDFLHLELRSIVEWRRQQSKDAKNEALTVPIRLRDGDLCRYCGQMVIWRGRTSTRSATFDHLKPGQAATVDTMVIACYGCNSELRDIDGRERERLRPEPASPFYSDFTAGWLTDRGHPVAATQRPGSQSDTAQRKTPNKINKARPGSQSDTAPSASDPATAPDTAVHNQATPQPPANAPPNGNSQAIKSRSAGSGRAVQGAGRVGSVPVTAAPQRTRARRSPRGRARRPQADT